MLLRVPNHSERSGAVANDDESEHQFKRVFARYPIPAHRARTNGARGCNCTAIAEAEPCTFQQTSAPIDPQRQIANSSGSEF